MKAWTVYAFADPQSGVVRYIGVTTQSPRQRLSQLSVPSMAARNPRLHQWLHNKRPTIVILERDPADGMQAEARWIAAFRSAGARLFNVCSGGTGAPGFKHTDATKSRLSRASEGRFYSAETRLKIATAKAGQKRPDLTERNRRNARLSAADVALVKASTAAGVEIARTFGISPAMVSLIRQGKRRS